MKYRKKPILVEATQWFKNGDHPEDYPSLMHDREAREHGAEGNVVKPYRKVDADCDTYCPTCGGLKYNHGWIDNSEGGLLVCPGDYVIKDERGKFHSCKPDVFEAKYEFVEEE